MGAIKQMLLLLVLFNLITSPFSFAHIANSYSGKMWVDESSASLSRGDNGVISHNKYAHTSARGGGGGAHSTIGYYGNGGESSFSRRGGAVIPAAAGATAKTNNHHNAANTQSMYWKDRVLIIIVTGLTSLLLDMCI